MGEFIFATGIENSYPIAFSDDRSSRRRDQMLETGHYLRWEDDFRLVRELGIDYLRYGPPYYLVQEASGECNFNVSLERIGISQTFDMRRKLDRLYANDRNITPIIDLCHFGLPDWANGFRDPDWPKKFAQYAAQFAREFPEVRLYTPVNEIYVAANFSGQLGFWNEGEASEKGFVAALSNLCRANVLAMEAILDEQPDAVFIQSESSEYFHPVTEADVEAADFLNKKRFLSLDLSYGHPVDSEMFRHLMRHGMSEADYDFFMRPADPGRRTRMLRHCVMGNDYYATNEHWVNGAARTRNHHRDDPERRHYYNAGEIFGYYVITHQYYDRYHLPVMHTETNRADRDRQCTDPENKLDEAHDWLQKQWANVLRLRQDGVPIVGFTWYPLVDLRGWDKLLREGNMDWVPAGLCDKDRNVRRAGKLYRELIKSWRDRLREPAVPTRGQARPETAEWSEAGPEAAGGATRPLDAVQRAERVARDIRALNPGIR